MFFLEVGFNNQNKIPGNLVTACFLRSQSSAEFVYTTGTIYKSTKPTSKQTIGIFSKKQHLCWIGSG